MPSGTKVNKLVLRGLVINAADGRGVHGISVRLKAPKALLANSDRETLSHADGAFELRLDQRRAVAQRKRPKVTLQFFDRVGQLVHVQDVPARFSTPSAIPLRVMLTEAKLATHLARPLSIERRSGRLVTESRVTIITHALSRLGNLGSTRYTNLLSERPRPFPPLDRFEDLLDDVWGTLDGNPAAQARFEDMLELFSAGSVGREPALPSAHLPEGTNSWAQGDFDSLIDQIRASASIWAPIEGLLGRETVVPLLLATAVVAGEPRLVTDDQPKRRH